MTEQLLTALREQTRDFSDLGFLLWCMNRVLRDGIASHIISYNLAGQDRAWWVENSIHRAMFDGALGGAPIGGTYADYAVLIYGKLPKRTVVEETRHTKIPRRILGIEIPWWPVDEPYNVPVREIYDGNQALCDIVEGTTNNEPTHFVNFLLPQEESAIPRYIRDYARVERWGASFRFDATILSTEATVKKIVEYVQRNPAEYYAVLEEIMCTVANLSADYNAYVAVAKPVDTLYLLDTAKTEGRRDRATDSCGHPRNHDAIGLWSRRCVVGRTYRAEIDWENSYIGRAGVLKRYGNVLEIRNAVIKPRNSK